eukprot:gene6368-11805_t
MVFLHLRDSRTKTRVRLENFDLSENVEVLRKRASEITGLDVNEQQKETEDVKPTQLTELLEKAMDSPLYKASVKRVLQDPDAIEQLIAATPALKKDPVALSLLRDPELLLQVAETANVAKIVEQHPALAQAAGHIIAAVTEDVMPLPIDNLNDEEVRLQEFERAVAREMNAFRDINTLPNEAQQRQTAQQHQISAAQLARALSQAGVSGAISGPQPTQQSQPPPAVSSPQVVPPPQAVPPSQAATPLQAAPPPRVVSPGQTAITADFFSQAIASALASQTPTNQATAGDTQHEAALQQMRDVGIMDDNLSLRALRQTGGNVEAAVSLIFEGEID